MPAAIFFLSFYRIPLKLMKGVALEVIIMNVITLLRTLVNLRIPLGVIMYNNINAVCTMDYSALVLLYACMNYPDTTQAFTRLESH